MDTQVYHTYRTKKGMEVTTYLTDAEALKRLQKIALSTAPDSFARSLCQRGANANLTNDMWAWVHRIVLDAEAVKVAAPEPVIDTSHALAFFAKASEKLANPRIRLHVESVDLVVARAGKMSKYHGDLLLTNGKEWEHRVLYGRITASGELIRGKAMTAPVFDLLQIFCESPKSACTAYGRLTGHCSFCGRPLEDERSTKVGYGPVCAERWGLPWGDVAIHESLTFDVAG